MQIYLDNISTTRIDPVVYEAMQPYYTELYGNASSIHSAGVKAASKIEMAREMIAQKINALPQEIFFTSGGTESNNWALKGIYFSNFEKGNHIIISSTEHPSIIETANWLSKHGAEISMIPVDESGIVDPASIRKMIRTKTILVSVMHANNETGTIQPVQEIGKLCRENKIFYHTDACQSFTKIPIDVQLQNLDLVTLNAHKIHGPKGIGALYIKKGIRAESLLLGGGQENGMRSGTYNTPAVAGFAKAVEISRPSDIIHMNDLRDYFLCKMRSTTEPMRIFGPEGESRLCNNICLGFENISGKHLFLELNKRGIQVSLGSACSSTKLTPSYVLKAMGFEDKVALQTIRIGISKWTTREEIDITIRSICEILHESSNLHAK